MKLHYFLGAHHIFFDRSNPLKIGGKINERNI